MNTIDTTFYVDRNGNPVGRTVIEVVDGHMNIKTDLNLLSAPIETIKKFQEAVRLISDNPIEALEGFT